MMDDPSNEERNELIKLGINHELLEELNDEQIYELLCALLYLIIKKRAIMEKGSWMPLL